MKRCSLMFGECKIKARENATRVGGRILILKEILFGPKYARARLSCSMLSIYKLCNDGDDGVAFR